MSRLVIFGTSEIASLAYYYFHHDSNYEVVGFCVDDEFVKGDRFNELPVVPFSKVTDIFPPSTHEMHVALSYAQFNKLREEKYFQAKAAGYKLASYICSKSTYWPDVSYGDNCFILEDQTIQPTVKLGNNVVLWSGNHIGHGSEIGDHVYVSSHVVISGHCRIGNRCFLGVNSTIKDFCTLENDCFIGMGARVTKDIKEGVAVISQGDPCYDSDDRRTKAILRSFFRS